MSTMAGKPMNPIEEYNAIVDFTETGELERLEALSKEELEAELVAAGYYEDGKPQETAAAPAAKGADIPTPPVASVPPAETPEAPKGRVVSLRPRASRTRWTLALIAAALGSSVVLVDAAVVALRDPTPAPPPTTPPPAPPRPTAPESVLVNEELQKKADALLDDAEQARARRDWRTCVTDVQDARKLGVPMPPRASRLMSDCNEIGAREGNAKARGDGGR